ncbi:hypothetical protein [Pseudoduganella namucuonensis]|uniref:hypothetical protein n=1 Tax=Pseudoduganella namucuonensis TaxID=1035707 RepID=UPI000A94C314|nr:hypothetical protein [Pseudoduganella namucuonensis]
MTANVAASVRARLLKLAKAEQSDFNQMLPCWAWLRYRGLAKNTAQLFTLFDLANLLLARRFMMPDTQVASSAARPSRPGRMPWMALSIFRCQKRQPLARLPDPLPRHQLMVNLAICRPRRQTLAMSNADADPIKHR